ncbi:hypothetical protein TNCV_4365341 [Trichonephila clavipes]|nr:hypothetical protein TNCV_4365341 [Trichonephila clavipes]
MALRWELSSPFGFWDYVYSVGAWRMWERETHTSCPPDIAGLLIRSTIRADVGVAIVPQTISRHLAEANLKSKRHFRALPVTPEHR